MLCLSPHRNKQLTVTTSPALKYTPTLECILALGHAPHLNLSRGLEYAHTRRAQVTIFLPVLQIPAQQSLICTTPVPAFIPTTSIVTWLPPESICSPVVVLTLLALAGRTVIVTRLYLLLLQVCFKASEVCVQPPDVLIDLQRQQ